MIPACAVSLALALIAGLLPGQIYAQTAVSPTVTLNPTSGPPGAVVSANGSGWAPGSVEALWEGSQSLGTSTVSSDGAWQLSFPVPADAAQGGHNITFEEKTSGVAITIVKVFTVAAVASPSPPVSPVPSVAAPPVTGTGGYRSADGLPVSFPWVIALVLAGLLLILGGLAARWSRR